MREECSVIKAHKNSAVIELVRRSECESCKACVFNKKNVLRMNAKTEVACKAGDRVLVEMPEKQVAGASFILFAVPLVLMLISVLITADKPWYAQILSICGALAIGLAVVILCNQMIKRKPSYLPTVKQIITENEKNDLNRGEAND